MKNAFDIITDVISLIKVPEVTDRIDGKVWPFVRPDNRNKTDITVGLLAGTNEWLQEATVNIRIHTPGISATYDGKVQNMPDYMTFNALSKIILPLIEGQYRETFYTIVDDPGEPIKDNDGSTFYRIRLHYYSIQSNYKNI